MIRMRVTCLILLTLSSLHGQPEPPANVQAYIPNLHWLKRVEPMWPDGTRNQGLQGAVRLLVTLDTNGLVTNAEPLSGPQIFRQAAADSVRQWEFQPVLRDGLPVAAMTDETVIFQIPGHKADWRPDVTEQLAASKRVAGLMERFPRSPQDVLADLEQSNLGASSLERFLHLPALAKAAISADDLSKAMSYANQALDTSGQPGVVQPDGDGIHDGNMVLGLVALKGGNLVDAREYLLKAGKTPGSPLLGSFGPNLSLAKALLDAGERDTVLEYFAECRAFWTMGSEKLDNWSATIRGGGRPDFGPNLLY
jgi:TonB family protein